MVVEKIISLEDLPVAEFMGVHNKNINEVITAFPKSKIISRGNEIKIIGSMLEVQRISDVIDTLQIYFHRYGYLDEKYIRSVLSPAEIATQEGTVPEEGAESGNLDEDVILHGNKGIIIKARTLNQQKIVKGIRENDLMFVIGPAGTGKTYISVALAVKALKNKEVKKIIITRPAVEAGESLGFLPGDLKEKIDPYLRPIYDALEDMIPAEKLKYYYENNVIEIAPLAYMRGRTLHAAFILLDEAQNTTAMQIKMFLTRMGNNCKMVVTGDRSQIDLPRNQKSGLVEATTILKNIPGIAQIELDKKDVMRHKLVERILEAYEKEQEKNP
ncbi:PhoH family protein [Cytophaga hutchinsonii]|uniref:PhoH-like protein n=1 Tax=Cytophaga hutchinsonii (strain ATCC 33406 / DSM 1761 / CIP 103989 / NBRC 15051 / NCIMB 9469 / D465) TaxID=269798 RepID=A0A6N4SUQ0_CYTH3|nr:phosphate starvation-inducible protein [Cytophaga hutchinsonii ATCC 33406]SFX21812.1 phosphate starvation-inducible protein PhoH [Cytophaga hutchinsonii ATCC 33406]